MIKSIPSYTDYACEGDGTVLARWWDAGQTALAASEDLYTKQKGWNSHPINRPVMRETENEFVNYPIDSDCPAHQLQRRIRRIAEDEMVTVEVR